MLQHKEVCFQVLVAIAHVSTDRGLLAAIQAVFLTFLHDFCITTQMFLGCFIQTFCKGVANGRSLTGVGTPTACKHPLAFSACCIDVYRNVQTLVFAILLAEFVHKVAA